MTERRSLAPEDLLALSRVGQPVPAPDGSVVIVPVTTYDVDENKGSTRLYSVPPDGGNPRPLTGRDRDSDQPATSGDGRTLAFIGKKRDDEHGQVYVMRLDGGEAEAVTDVPLGASDPRWLPDGSGILFLAGLFRVRPTLEGTRGLVEQRAEQKVKAVSTEDRVYRYWDRWLTDGPIHHIFHFDLETKELRDLTPDVMGWMQLDDPAGQWDIAPDGTEVAFSVDISEKPHDRLQLAVFTVPISVGKAVRLTEELPAHQLRPRYSPDGRFIVYGIQREWDFYADPVRLVRYDRALGTETEVAKDWDRSASGWEFTREGDRIVLAAEDNARLALFTVATTGGEPELLARDGSLHGPRPTAGGSVYCRRESLIRPAEVVRVAIPTGLIDPVTRFNDDLMAQIELGPVEEIEFPGADGNPVQAYLVYPPDFDRSRRWPLVHSIHGGPHGISGDVFHFRWNPHAFAAPGYVVALVNFHGSTSWGYDFAAGIHGAWGDKPGSDVLAATDYLLGLGFIDPDRMAIAGGSYGGYLTSWLITQTDRFAAAVCHAGVTDLLGQYATDITSGRERAMGGTPWENVAAILEWSPVHQSVEMSTPTLVIHGEKDYRVVVTQGLELYGILKAQGVDARLVYYPDEGHWILKPQNSLHWYGEVLSWLERYLG